LATTQERLRWCVFLRISTVAFQFRINSLESISHKPEARQAKAVAAIQVILPIAANTAIAPKVKTEPPFIVRGQDFIDLPFYVFGQEPNRKNL
jgi:hypothetical protein